MQELDKSPELDSEMAFLEAMRVYRQARESGDPQAIAEAEEAWRGMVRQEMIEREGCAN
jgi:hypothetical protein